MSFATYSYLVSIIVVTGIALIFEYITMRHEVKPYLSVVVLLALLSFIGTAILEPPALTSQAWVYNPNSMFYVHIFGAEIETYLYSATITIVISTATIVFAKREEHGEPLLSFSQRPKPSSKKRK